jgi:hypothetical protein
VIAMQRIVLLGLLVALALWSAASPAAAGYGQSIDTKGGVVWFEDHGEVVGALDERKDGLGVQATIAWNDKRGRNHTFFVADTNGVRGNGTRERFSIPEGTRVSLTLCYLRDDVGIWKCSKPQGAMA